MNFTDVRDPRLQVPAKGAVAKSDENAFFKGHVLEWMDDHNNDEEVGAIFVGGFVVRPRRFHSSLRLITCSGARS